MPQGADPHRIYMSAAPNRGRDEGILGFGEENEVDLQCFQGTGASAASRGFGRSFGMHRLFERARPPVADARRSSLQRDARQSRRYIVLRASGPELDPAHPSLAALDAGSGLGDR